MSVNKYIKIKSPNITKVNVIYVILIMTLIKYPTQYLIFVADI